MNKLVSFAYTNYLPIEAENQHIVDRKKDQGYYTYKVIKCTRREIRDAMLYIGFMEKDFYITHRIEDQFFVSFKHELRPYDFKTKLENSLIKVKGKR